ncbi:MAG TPA: GAF domain-containing protein, partial [Candidatus Polarisedimenticolia bacterium]|nr:GAF domain-containing protein [Candidatus Polarisedimenticolia bacterium]
CGTAVAERRNINVPDVSKATNYLACSAATRSELVILIRRGGTIYAQIDIDSHEIDAFDPKSVTEVERVADWLAKAYEQRATSR